LIVLDTMAVPDMAAMMAFMVRMNDQIVVLAQANAAQAQLQADAAAADAAGIDPSRRGSDKSGT
jgi:hypothetical protein